MTEQWNVRYDFNLSMAGSNVGGIRETQEMIDFAAHHGIVPKIELNRR
ncbi:MULTISPECIES: hypothetical protein [Paenibacillus]|nr:hypothetical protein WG8_2520 [Paenibacillus sp. Aloe-11]